jgi:predicted enzyme related to lactoylglutathione lyase
MKTHLNLATKSIERSIAFYSILLNTKPRKALADYALFVTDEPGLELALDLAPEIPAAGGVHFGIYVETADDVENAIARLKRAGYVSSVEREETCCYANQTKVWATDPDGRRWEVYTVHEETEERDSATTTCCADDVGKRSCCPA